MEFLSLLDNSATAKLVASAILVVLVVALRTLIGRMLQRQMSKAEVRRRWIVNVRNASLLMLTVGLAAIWLEELQTLGTALVAFTVAVVIATKEVLLCVNGSAIRAATNAYTIGDRIEIDGDRVAGRDLPLEIDGDRGDVIDFNLFTTTVLEVGPGHGYHLRTGRTIVIPNSKLLSYAVTNESYMKQYVVHVFAVPLSFDQDWEPAEKLLLQTAENECAPFLDDARTRMETLEKEHSLEGLPVQPRIYVHITDKAKIDLLVRIPSPVGRQGHIEQAIIRKFLREFPPSPDARPSLE